MLGIETLLEVSMGKAPGERRRGRRFDLRMKCCVSSQWRKIQELEGVTEDISRTGILVRFENASIKELVANPREAFRVLIELPRSPNFANRCLECMCGVARVADASKEHPAVAFEIRRIQVRDLENKSAASPKPLRAGPVHGKIQ